MLLEQPHEKAGGFWAPFTGSMTNYGAGTTAGLQGQGKANMANTIASSLPMGESGIGAQNPLLNAPNITNEAAMLGPQKLTRAEKKAQKTIMNQGAGVNPEYNNAVLY